MTSTSVPSMISEAAEWAVGFRLESAPDDVVELSKLQIANIIAAVLAGSRSAAGRRALAAMEPSMSSGPCTLMPRGDHVALWDALYVHAVYANALELDDFHYRGHLGPAVVLVPMVLGEMLGIDGRKAITAQIVANEVAGRLGWAVNAEIRHGHQRSYLLRFAAAAAAGVILGIDRRQMEMALAISMTQPENPLHPGMYSPDTKALSAAGSVVEGVRSAFLALEGYSAASDILENRSGFFRQFTLQRETASPFVQFGEAWSTHALCFKRYAACAYAAGAVDAALAIRSDPAFDPDAVAGIEIVSSLPALVMERLARPHEQDVLTPVNVQFSLVRSVSHALWRGDIRGSAFLPDAFAEAVEPIRRLSKRAVLTHDWTYTMEQLKGLDAGLNSGGGRQSADMIQFYRTSSEFRRMFGSARAIGARDLLRLIGMPGDDKSYFVRRWARSVRSHARNLVRREVPESRSGPLGDLRRLEFRMGGRVKVVLKSGRELVAERIVPSGMAGDPNRATVVREKLKVEAGAVIGERRAERLWDGISSLDRVVRMELPSLATSHEDTES